MQINFSCGYGHQVPYFSYGIKKHQQFETLLRNNDFYPQIANDHILNYIYEKKINHLNITQSTEETEISKNTEDSQTIIECIKEVFKHIVEAQEKPSHNDPLLKGNKYFILAKCTQDQKYLNKSFNFYLKAAEQENMSAQNNLAYCYQFGLGVNKDHSMAFRWYQKASNQNDAFAHNNLGCCYLNGLEREHEWNVEKNFTLANAYFELASNLGNPNASYNLAVSFSYKSNINEALPFYHEAAYQGNPYAQHFFLNTIQAAEQGDPQAQKNLYLMYKNGLGIEKNLQLAFEWCHKAAEQGNPHAQYGLSLMYGNGEGTEKDYELSFKWCLKAAEQEDSHAQHYLSLMYGKGIGTTKNFQLAFEWCYKAAEQANPQAQYYLAVMYGSGEGVKKDLRLAFKWCHKAAEQGNPEAQYFISIIYGKGMGIERDSKLAFMWCLQSAQQGFSDARNELFSLYKNGEGVEKNPKLAYEWFLYDIAASYEKDIGCKKNLSSAVAYYKLCITNKYEPSNISKNFLAEKGLARCLLKQGAKLAAFKQYKKLAEKNDSEAMEQLILCYKNGIGTTKNTRAASEWQIKVNESLKKITPEESESMFQQLLDEAPSSTKKPKKRNRNKARNKKKKSTKEPLNSHSTKFQNEANKSILVLTEKNDVPLVKDDPLHSLIKELYKTFTYNVANRVTKRWMTKDIPTLQNLKDRDNQGQIIKRYEALDPQDILQQRAHHYLPDLERIIKCKNTQKIYATQIPDSDNYQIQAEFNYGTPKIQNQKGIISFGIDKATNTLYHRCFKPANLSLTLPTMNTNYQIQNLDDDLEGENSWQNVSKINFEILEDGELKVTFTGEDHSLIIYPQNKEYFEKLKQQLSPQIPSID